MEKGEKLTSSNEEALPNEDSFSIWLEGHEKSRKSERDVKKLSRDACSNKKMVGVN